MANNVVPAVPTPRALRPFLQFTRLPDRALAVVRRALEDDAEFRARVAIAAATVEDEVGPAGLMFLRRSEGWEEELGALAGEAAAAAETERDARRVEQEDRSAARRASAAEAAARRAEEAAGKARLDAQRALATVVEERRLRREAEAEIERLRAQIHLLEESAQVAAARSAGELAAVTDRLSVAEAAASSVDPPPPPPDVEPAVDRATLEMAIDRARAAAEEVVEAVKSVVALSAPRRSRRVPEGRSEPPTPIFAPVRGRPARRRPLDLPRAVFDNSPDAASFLVRVPGVLVLVDGYNAAMALWPDLEPAELRQRLVDALAELVARTGAGVHVVFDGAEVSGPAVRAGGRVPVRVSFSPPDVEADDVILEVIDGLPPTQAVVVASSDRRVQDGAIQRGCNVISSAQLAGALGR